MCIVMTYTSIQHMYDILCNVQNTAEESARQPVLSLATRNKPVEQKF